MKEIKFRGRNAELPRCWIYGYFVIEHGKSYIINEDGKFKIIAGTEGQFMGKKDVNEKEIYEGDIIIDHYWNSLWFTKRIEVKIPDIYIWLQEHKLRKGSYYKIIGNIHENPELLEE